MEDSKEILTYLQSLDYISSLKKFGSKLELENLKKLLDMIGNPQDRLNFIHIAGTNGKGSITTFCSNILSKASYTTGKFISPYVVDFRERFQVNSEMITEEELAWIVSTIKPFSDKLIKEDIIVTEFEMITAIGFAFFLYKRCDIVCLEVGLGGRFDATNIIKDPLVCVITSISFDHMDRLGSTLKQIAFEKAGIIKDNSRVVCYPINETETFDVLYNKCSEFESVSLILPSLKTLEIKEKNIKGSSFSYNGIDYNLNLPGEHQIYNAITSIEAIKSIKNCKLKQIKKSTSKNLKISEEDIQIGLESTLFPARFEIISDSPKIILDGAHNVGGANALSKTLMLDDAGKTIIFGVLKDKEYKSIIDILSRVAKKFISVEIKSNSACVKKEEIAAYCKEIGVQCCTAKDYKEALEAAVEDSTIEDYIVVCGSLYLIGDIRKMFIDNI